MHEGREKISRPSVFSDLRLSGSAVVLALVARGRVLVGLRFLLEFLVLLLALLLEL